MTAITSRATKGAPLTNAEVDANFANLNEDKLDASNNLSEITDAAAARANLGAASLQQAQDYATAMAIALG